MIGIYTGNAIVISGALGGRSGGAEVPKASDRETLTFDPNAQK